MSARKVLVEAKDKLPAKKIMVNKDWMMEWLTKYGKSSDLKWFQEVCNKYPTKFVSNLNGASYELPDWAKVRAEFLKKYFPNAYPKKQSSAKETMSYMDKLAALIASKEQEEAAQAAEAAPEPEPAPEAPAPASKKGKK